MSPISWLDVNGSVAEPAPLPLPERHVVGVYRDPDDLAPTSFHMAHELVALNQGGATTNALTNWNGVQTELWWDDPNSVVLVNALQDVQLGLFFRLPTAFTEGEAKPLSIGGGGVFMGVVSRTEAGGLSVRLAGGAAFGVPTGETEVEPIPPTIDTGLGITLHLASMDIPQEELPVTDLRWAVFAEPTADGWGTPIAQGTDGVIDASRRFHVDLTEVVGVEEGDVVFVYLHDLTPAQVAAWEADPENDGLIEFNHAARPGLVE
jgi:hypothetical protein